jgi:AhpD family alkylhydroperoxidase
MTTQTETAARPALRGFRRINYPAASPKALQAMMKLSGHAHGTVDPILLELVNLRVSQINGCGFCLDMHSKELRAKDVPEQKLYLLSVWRETSLYSARERAALAWAEAVTKLGEHGVPDDVYEMARAQFSEAELVDLTIGIVTINGWNRLSVAFGAEAGHYKVGSLG